MWGIRRGVDEAIFPLSVADDKRNLTAEPRNNDVEEGVLMWRLFYINGELAYGARTNFENKTYKKFRNTFRQKQGVRMCENKAK